MEGIRNSGRTSRGASPPLGRLPPATVSCTSTVPAQKQKLTLGWRLGPRLFGSRLGYQQPSPSSAFSNQLATRRPPRASFNVRVTREAIRALSARVCERYCVGFDCASRFEGTHSVRTKDSRIRVKPFAAFENGDRAKPLEIAGSVRASWIPAVQSRPGASAISVQAVAWWKLALRD